MSTRVLVSNVVHALDDSMIREIRLQEACIDYTKKRYARMNTPCRDTTEDAVEAYVYLKRVVLNTLPL